MRVILEKIKSKKLPAEAALVFSDKRDAEGLKIARSYGVEVAAFSPKDHPSFEAYENALADLLEKKGVEWVICAGYMRIIKSTILRRFKNRIINIHPSLLPAFPGLKAQQQALDYGVAWSGCTVHFVDEGVDTGPIITQRPVAVLPGDTENSLSLRIIKTEHNLYWRAIAEVINGFEIRDRKIILKNGKLLKA